MLVRRLLSTDSTCSLLALTVCGCHRPAEPSASKSAPVATASAASASSQSAAPTISIHDRIDDAQSNPPTHAVSDNAKTTLVWRILTGYEGAVGAPASVTRTKQDAQKFANVVQLEVGAGADFETVALKYSDDPNVKTNRGKLGEIGRTQMDNAFTDYAFALLKFETGPVPLDTPAGLEIIRRME